MNTSDMADTARDLQERAQDQAERWQEKARESALRARETARNATEVTDRYVHEHVWTTVTFAALGGCLLGFLMGRMRH